MVEAGDEEELSFEVYTPTKRWNAQHLVEY